MNLFCPVQRTLPVENETAAIKDEEFVENNVVENNDLEQPLPTPKPVRSGGFISKLIPEQPLPIKHSDFEKTDLHVFDREAKEESSISLTVEDMSQNQTSSTSNVEIQSTISLNKDPAL
ncbi:unnamed protein product [Colias eurytheme]|nr:unnamed protein product [Colias eurytheme]